MGEERRTDWLEQAQRVRWTQYIAPEKQEGDGAKNKRKRGTRIDIRLE